MFEYLGDESMRMGYQSPNSVDKFNYALQYYVDNGNARCVYQTDDFSIVCMYNKDYFAFSHIDDHGIFRAFPVRGKNLERLIQNPGLFIPMLNEDISFPIDHIHYNISLSPEYDVVWDVFNSSFPNLNNVDYNLEENLARLSHSRGR